MTSPLISTSNHVEERSESFAKSATPLPPRPRRGLPVGARVLFALGVLTACVAFLHSQAAAEPFVDQVACNVIANAIASPTFSTAEQARAGFADATVMLRVEMARQIVESTPLRMPALEQVRQEILAALYACHRSMRELQRLDATTPDFEGLARKTINASPALFRRGDDGELTPRDQRAVDDLFGSVLLEALAAGFNAYQASEERTTYQKHYRAARRAGVKLHMMAVTHSQAERPAVFGIGLQGGAFTQGAIPITSVVTGSPAEAAGIAAGDMIVAIGSTTPTAQTANDLFISLRGTHNSPVSLTVSRAGNKRALELRRTMELFEVSLLSTEIDGSWAGFYSSDFVSFTNSSGVDLTNVKLHVLLRGRHGKNSTAARDQHLHFIGHWPAGESRLMRYLSSSASGIAADESVDQIDTLTYQLSSDQFIQTNHIPYTGEAYDVDVRRYVGNAQFVGTWSNYPPDHWFFNSGFEFHRQDKQNFPVSKVTVSAWRGEESKAFCWTISDQKLKGYNAFTDSRFNNWNPDRVTVSIEMPYTQLRIEREWKLR